MSQMPKFVRIRPIRWCVSLLSVVSFCVAGRAMPAAAQDAAQELAARPLFLIARAGRGGERTSWQDASGLAVLKRRVSLVLYGVPLRDALDTLGNRVGLKITTSSDVPRLSSPVDLNAPDITVGAAFSALLYDASADVLFTPSGQVAIVKRGMRVPVAGRIVGRVTDVRTGLGLAAADVLLERTSWHSATDSGGRYQLVDVDTGVYTLTVRRLGYTKQSRKVAVRADQTDTVNVVLEPAAVALNDLVTTASGQQRRRDIGNPITTISADSVLRTAPIRNLTDLLQNRVPGLTVQHTSGAPGDPAKLRLRGIGSIHGNNDPVVIVDGVRVYAAQSAARSGNLTNLGPTRTGPGGAELRVNPVDVPAPSPLDQIDPNIIDKIEVFRGPSAATLYGADAANGVIVITTKKGKPGPTTWSASVTAGRTSPPGQYPIGYYRWGHYPLTGERAFCTLLDIGCVQDSLVQFQALNVPSLSPLGAGHRTALSLTASGGSQALTYSLTGSYGDETGLLQLPGFEAERFRTAFNREAPDWMQRPHQLKDWAVTSNITARLNPSADVTLSTSLGRSEQRRTSLEQQLSAMEGTYIDTLNNIYYRSTDLASGGGYVAAPATTVLRDYYTRQTASSITFTTGLTGNWRPSSWFTAIGQAGLNVIPRRDVLLLPAGLVSITDSGAASEGTGRSLVSTFNLQGTAQKRLGHGFTFQTNVGANLKTESTNDLISSARGLVAGTNGLNGAKHISATELGSNTSVFGWWIEPRITGERFSISTGLRLDGGSAYGVRLSKSGGGGFLGGLLALPQLSTSWVISEEPWFPLKNFFSSLQLRASYGHAQVQPGPTDRLRLYADTVVNGIAGKQLLLTTLGNTQLKPERSTELTGGFLADVLDSRLSVDLTFYRKVQKDALMPVQLPPSVRNGTTVITNIGDIQNIGTELTLRVTPVRSRALTWSMEANYAHNTNTLAKLGAGVPANKSTGIVEGYPVEARWARPILGYADQNGDGVIQPTEIQVGDSLVYMGRLLPAYTTSFFGNLALFGGAVGVTAGFDYNHGATQIDQTARTNWVLERALVDATVPQAEQAAVLASTRSCGGGVRDISCQPTDYGLIQEVATFRFNSLAVSYRAPQSVARLVRARQLQVAVQGANLGMHSTYHGKDPDVNSWGPGESIQDTGQLPQPRTWQLSVYLTY